MARDTASAARAPARERLTSFNSPVESAKSVSPSIGVVSRVDRPRETVLRHLGDLGHSGLSKTALVATTPMVVLAPHQTPRVRPMFQCFHCIGKSLAVRRSRPRNDAAASRIDDVASRIHGDQRCDFQSPCPDRARADAGLHGAAGAEHLADRRAGPRSHVAFARRDVTRVTAGQRNLPPYPAG